MVSHVSTLERHGWAGALIGTGCDRPDPFTVSTALAVRTTTFEPLIAVRLEYLRPTERPPAVRRGRRRPRHHIWELYAAGLNSCTIASLLPCMRDTDGAPSPRATPPLLTVLTSERDRLEKTIRARPSHRHHPRRTPDPGLRLSGSQPTRGLRLRNAAYSLLLHRKRHTPRRGRHCSHSSSGQPRSCWDSC